MSHSDEPQTNGKPEKPDLSRRKFVTTAATAAGLTIVPRRVLGRGVQAPSDTANIAAVGVGGMGRSNTFAVASENIVALCDVDWDYTLKSWDSAVNPRQQTGRGGGAAGAGRTNQANLTPEQQKRMADAAERARRIKEIHLPNAKRYTDYREMLDKQKDIDGVIVATPDHLHAVIASAAMDLGKHVYVQKPLTWSVEEARHLAKKAKEKKVVTQMGNQGHSEDDTRTVLEYLDANAIGNVTEVQIWTNRPLAFWPQGIPRPAPLKAGNYELRWNMSGVMARLANAMAGAYPIPEGLEWDLFLGPSPVMEYHPVYHPFNWRGWVDWGCGAIGDMGAHLIDQPFWGLDLGFPTTVETVSTPFNKETFPMSTTTYYEFPAKGSRGPIKLTWYDGGLKPTKPPEFGEKEELNGEGGVIYYGTKGKLMHLTYGRNPRLLPQSLHESVGEPPKKYPRIATSHEMNWVEAMKGKAEASSPFEYAARLTEVMLLGVVALKANTKIHYDGANMRITNNAPAANDFLRRDYREGFKLA
jgi:predicted dehydrogenase